MAFASIGVCAVSVVFLFRAVGAAPALTMFSSAPQPVDTATYGAPSVSNAWASLLVSTSNILGFNAFGLPPFSQGWNAKVDAVSLGVNGSGVPPTTTVWLPYGVVRTGSAQLADGTAVTVSTEIRMVFEASAILLTATVQLPPTRVPNIDLEIDFQTPVRYYPQAGECPSWHYPTHSSSCCWNWFPPMPTVNDTQADFSYAWTNSTFLSLPDVSGRTLGIADKRSPAVGAYAFSPTTPTPTSTAGSVATWGLPLSATTSTTWSVGIVYVVSNTTLSDSIAAAGIVAAAFDDAWTDAALNWQIRFDEAFTPGNGHFSGHLPLLTVSDADASGEANMSALERIYYHGVISLLANERTNLPVPLSGAVCSTSSTLTGTPVSGLDLPVFQSLERLQGAVRPSAPGGLLPYLQAHAAKHNLPASSLPAIAGSGYSSQPLFVTGGALNATTNMFYWDNGYGSVAMALLHPALYTDQVDVWAGSIDPVCVQVYVCVYPLACRCV